MAYVLGIDIGTSSMRCFAVDKGGRKIAEASTNFSYLHPQPDRSEIDPEELWRKFKDVVTNALASGHLDAKEAACMGIACQRNTFCLWNRSTGEPLCNLISWQDKRAADICREWNQSFRFKLLHAGGALLHGITRSMRFLLAREFTMQTHLVLPRLQWAYRHLEGVRELALEENLCFGTIDTWLLWKLTDGAVHATDYSSVSTTVLFDSFYMKYHDNPLAQPLLGFHPSILPEVKDTGGLFGHSAEHHFGAEIPITGIIADQASAMFGQGCWNPGDVKCTLGTGLFLSVNTGNKPFVSTTGFLPVIAWKIGEEVQWATEASFPCSGNVVEWGRQFGLYSSPAETEAIAETVEDSGGLYFVPAFDGIQVPFYDPRCTASVIGLTHSSSKEHMTRALLESLAFTFKQVFDAGESKISFLNTAKIRVDGGVCLNNFVIQMCSDLIGHSIQRPKDIDMTVYGAVYVAGLASGFWNSREVMQLWQLGRQFDPKGKNSKEGPQLQKMYKRWLEAVQRSREWHHPTTK